MNIIQKLHTILDPTGLRSLYKILVLSIAVSILDMFGAASIMPIIAVLSDSDLIFANEKLFLIYELLSFSSVNRFLIFLCLVSLMLLFISLFLKSVLTYLQINFVVNQEYYIGKKLATVYLHQPYSWFIEKHSSDLSKDILSEIGNLIGNALVPIITLYTNILVVFFMLALLSYVDFSLTFGVGVVFGSVYLVLYVACKKLLLKLGSERFVSNEKRFKIISDAFGSPKEVKFHNLEETFLGRFSQHAQVFARSHALSQAIGQMPRYGLEAIGFGGLLLLMVLLVDEGNSLTDKLPMIALFAYAGYRVLPALQQIFASGVRLKFSSGAIDRIVEQVSFVGKPSLINHNPVPVSFNKCIKFTNVSFRYPNSELFTLREVSFEIKKGQKIGFIGETGSGKSTLVDLLLGLLNPSEGSITVDGVDILGGNGNSWRLLVGYVPQSIFLVDCSLMDNIAFGFDDKEVDAERVRVAASVADIHDFISHNLTDGYYTNVGERGVKLSGGQKQRVGLARALYRRPQLLVLDEATSALDIFTEERVTSAINRFDRDLTIISVAHRMDSLKYCDVIYEVANGTIAEVTLTG
ncbi:ABC transporter ATP-binding protein/permease [Alphaproteobacteria bacterium]|nr:ABC transporter ATP-binding protein/permease [Alphaproteobacteria bacterium]